MKRTLIYLVMGVLLGVAVTLLPLMVYYPAYLSRITHTGTLSWEEEEVRGAAEQEEVFRGTGIFLSSLVYAGSISALALVLALGIYLLSKRWITA